MTPRAPALLPVLSLGLAYAALFALLAADGHRPTVSAGLPVPAEHYYAAAAIYVTPLCVALWWLFAAVADRVAGGGRRRQTRQALAWTWSVPLLLLFVLPDLLVYTLAGHAALGRWLPLYAPLAPLAVFVLSARALRRIHGIGWGRALGAALVALVTQGIPAALLLR